MARQFACTVHRPNYGLDEDEAALALVGGLAVFEGALIPRANPNVYLEAGSAWGRGLYLSSGSGDFGRKKGQVSTGWGGYFRGSGQRMNVDVFVRTYFGGAAQR